MGQENVKNNNQELNKLRGRQWIETTQLMSQRSGLTFVSGIVRYSDGYYCNRCGTICVAQLPDQTFYCRTCIALGRVCQTDFLYRYEAEQIKQDLQANYLTWEGELTPSQQKISQELLNSLALKQDHLVHAVTGAGKTEMLFEVVNQALIQGERVCLATPRIDVVNELYPRFQQAFNTITIGKYHGQEYHEPNFENLTICTTHQLLKFYHAFDLIIIDEVDAFPFRNNAVLNFGAKNAVKTIGSRFFLTATPSKEQLALVKQKKLNYSLLKRRFHGHHLPVPKLKMLIRPTIIKNKRLNHYFLFLLKQNIAFKKPILIFVPKIRQLSIYREILTKKFPALRFETVYSGDKDRLAKVASFRNGELDILLTTTILERGVTIKHVQVFILDADDAIYNSAALIQIAGRVGRAKDDPNGNIYFFYHQYTANIKAAVKEIKGMNHDWFLLSLQPTHQKSIRLAGVA